MPTLLLTISQLCKKNTSTGRSELLFLLGSVVLTYFSAVESLQWVFWLSPEESVCQVFGALSEYGALMLIMLLGCIGLHLVLLLRPPKCLMVIDEVKNRRHNYLVIFYCFVTFLFPLFLLALPFVIEPIHYGASGYICWISLSNTIWCDDAYLTDGLIEQATLFYFWALAITVMLVLVVIAVSASVCWRRSPCQFSTNHCTVILVTALLLIGVMMVESLFVVDVMIGLRKMQYLPATTFIKAIGIPFIVMLATLALLVRICYIRFAVRLRGIFVMTHTKRVGTNIIYPHEATPLLTTPTSTKFDLPNE